ncbi:MAG TPA: hypothetical protein VJM32_05000 [Candidatus Saccharimonadales bacterium]|nr:hypothetical protein [Candidatus Saccharimonadales bacterium]
METPHSPEHTDRDPANVLGEVLRELAFEETPAMAELHGVIADAMRDGDPATALAAYARYQELGQKVADAADDRGRANLALNIATAQLLAERGETERFGDALRDCADDAYGQGFLEVTETLDTLSRDLPE